MSDIEDRVKKIVVEHLGVEESKIQSDSKFIWAQIAQILQNQ